MHASGHAAVQVKPVPVPAVQVKPVPVPVEIGVVASGHGCIKSPDVRCSGESGSRVSSRTGIPVEFPQVLPVEILPEYYGSGNVSSQFLFFGETFRKYQWECQPYSHLDFRKRTSGNVSSPVLEV